MNPEEKSKRLIGCIVLVFVGLLVVGLYRFATAQDPSLFFFFPCGGCCFFVFLNKLEPKKPSRPNWDTTQSDHSFELSQIAGLVPGMRNRICGQKGIFLGYSVSGTSSGNNRSPLFFAKDAHLCTFGKAGCGKIATVQTPALLLFEGSALVIDVNGQLCAITARHRHELGQEVFAINPFGHLGIPSVTYNPLMHINLGHRVLKRVATESRRPSLTMRSTTLASPARRGM
jgi:hypothetical protein